MVLLHPCFVCVSLYVCVLDEPKLSRQERSWDKVSCCGEGSDMESHVIRIQLMDSRKLN